MLSEMEKKYYKKRNLINFLAKDNEDMESNLKILNEQNKRYREELESNEQEIAGCEATLEQLRRDIKKKDEQIQMLKREDNDPQVKESEKKIKADLEKVKSDKRQLQATIEHRQQEIALLNSKIADEKRIHEEMMERDKREKIKLRNEIEEVKKKLNRGYRELSEQNVSEEESQSEDKQEEEERRQEGANSNEHSDRERQKSQEVSKDSMQKVAHEEEEAAEEEKQRVLAEKEDQIKRDMELQKIKDSVGKELRYIVRSERIQPQDLEDYLIDRKELQNNKVSLSYVKMKLEGDPFRIYDSSKCEVILEAIKEENGADKKNYTPQEIAQPILGLIGDYKIMEDAEEQQKREQMSKRYFADNRDRLSESLEVNLSSFTDATCNEESLRKVLIQNNIVMPAEDHEFMILQLFRQSQRLDMLPFRQLLAIFSLQRSSESPRQGSKGMGGITLEDLDENDLLDEY